MSRDRLIDGVFVAACLAMLGIVAVRSTPPTEARRPAEPGFAVSERIDKAVPADYQAHERNVVLVVNSQCRFCTGNMPLYRKLRDKAAACGGTSLTFVSTEADAVTREYLAANGITGASIAHVPREALKGTPYPTILLVGRSGTVERKVQGAVSSDREQEVLMMAGCGA